MEDLFLLQKTLSEAGLVKKSVPPEERLNRALIALTAEVGELIQSCSAKWKWWKTHSNAPGEAQGELLDVFLFVVLIATLLDIRPDEFVDKAYEKLALLARKEGPTTISPGNSQ